MSSNTTSCPCQSALQVLNDSNLFDQRTTWDITKGCLATLFACTWLSVHPNMPGPLDGRLRTIMVRLELMFWALVVPEMVIFWALRQWLGARALSQEYKEDSHWTQAHGFFAQMGGFTMKAANGRVAVLFPYHLEQLYRDGYIEFPEVSEDEVTGRSKGDAFSKILVLGQTSWFIAQCVARRVIGLSTTQLEVATLSFCALNGVMYFLWWNKPLDPTVPVFVRLKRDVPPWMLELDAFKEMPETELVSEHTQWIAISSDSSTSSSSFGHEIPRREEWVLRDMYPLPPPSRPSSSVESFKFDNYLQGTRLSPIAEMDYIESDTPSTSPESLHARSAMGSSTPNSSSASEPRPFRIGEVSDLKPDTPAMSVDSLHARSFMSSTTSSSSSSVSAQSISSESTCSPKIVRSNVNSPTSGRYSNPPSSPNPPYHPKFICYPKVIYVSHSDRNFLKNAALFLYRRLKEMSDPCSYVTAEEIQMSRMPAFYAYPRKTTSLIQDHLLCHIVVLLISSGFGAIHLAAWSSDFPTVKEAWLWRVATITIITAPVMYAVPAILAAFLYQARAWTVIKNIQLIPLLAASRLIVPAVYITARLALLIESVVSLRALPMSALHAIPWTTYVPHI